MFYVPEILNMRRRGKLARCWLAGTLSEKLFKKIVSNNRIAEDGITEYCEEIVRVINDSGNYRQHFSLCICSYLMLGVFKLYSYQLSLFEKSLLRIIQELQAVKFGGGEWRTRGSGTNRGEELTRVVEIRMDVFPPSPQLNLSRPFRRDINLLQEISPMSHRRMRELEESTLLSIPALTEEQAELWLMNDEGALWPGMDFFKFSQSERAPDDDAFVHAVDAARLDLPTRILRTPSKRPFVGTNVDTPSKRQRRRRIPAMDASAEERAEETVPAILPMEQDEELLPLPEHPLVPVAPEDPVDPVTPVDPVDPIILPVDQAANSTIPAVVVQPIVPAWVPRKRRKVDVKTNKSRVQQERRQNNVQADTVPLASTKAIPIKRIVPPVFQFPSTIFKFGMENLRRNRLREVHVEVLRRYDIATCGPFDVETDYSSIHPSFRPRDLPRQSTDDPSTVVRDRTDTTKSNKNGTGVQATEMDIGPPVEVPQAEATDDLAFDTTSEAKTVSIGKVQIFTDPPANGDAKRRSNSSDPDTVNLDAFLPPPRPKDHDKVTKSSHSKTPSSSEVIIDIESEPSSPRSEMEMAAESTWTKKDLEACLEVHWRDNDVIIFEQLASPKETSDVDATACFIYLLELYKEDKVNLTQAGTHAPMYIEKVVTSVPMDWST